jgi:predicted DCC family thiol-disulfide oxidoreductase YuxK
MPVRQTTDSTQVVSTAARALYTVIYDGECGYCRKQMNRMRGRDFRRQFAFVPSGAPDLIERFPQLAGEDFNLGLRMVEPDGRVHVGADAVYQVARRLSGTRWIAWVFRAPGIAWLARRVYAKIAARRHRLSA